MSSPFIRSGLWVGGLCVCLGVAGISGAQAASPAQWSDDVAASLAKAKAEDKDVLMDFTGSDWCGWCIKLRQEVFENPSFVGQAPGHFVLVELDFPQQKKLPPAVAEQNKAWGEKFKISGYPTIMLVDGTGLPFAQLGYAAGGPGPYLKTMEAMRARRVLRDQKWDQAAKATGVEKIKLLHEGLLALQDDRLVFQFYGTQIKELLELDADGKAGIKAQYEEKFKKIQAQKLFESKVPAILGGAEEDGEKARQELLDLAKDKRMTPEFRQKALFLASQVCRIKLHDMKQAETLYEQAIAADPESEIGIKLQTHRSHMFPKDVPVMPVEDGGK